MALSGCPTDAEAIRARTRRYRGGREALRAIGMERADRVDLFRDLLGGASAATAHPNEASRS